MKLADITNLIYVEIQQNEHLNHITEFDRKLIEVNFYSLFSN